METKTFHSLPKIRPDSPHFPPSQLVGIPSLTHFFPSYLTSNPTTNSITYTCKLYSEHNHFTPLPLNNLVQATISLTWIIQVVSKLISPLLSLTHQFLVHTAARINLLQCHVVFPFYAKAFYFFQSKKEKKSLQWPIKS